MHIRNIPGRKSDMNNATWIADLLAHGLIRSSFVPPAPIQELRDAVEYHDLGSQHFARRDKDQMTKRLLQRLRDLGVVVEVKAA